LVEEREAIRGCWKNAMQDLISKISYSSPRVAEACLKLMTALTLLELVDSKSMGSVQQSLWKLHVFSNPKSFTIGSLEFLIVFLSHHNLQEVRAPSPVGTSLSLFSIMDF
jgi:hypothetical protein